ncbi:MULTISPECIES: ATP-binding protein [unclassified Vibrio]|uniref:C4-dicarboxylate transport sensor protein DctB n=1 Tax=Vibrio sp. HB236076 TaxID=3232307 RepID=A0AB39HDH2_9VIBR|nr:ATP-binding protein [Vibrio sp. HB161653]MDP5253836.1 ATP-binding protein [Vibrio sp. HB161653]
MFSVNRLTFWFIVSYLCLLILGMIGVKQVSYQGLLDEHKLQLERFTSHIENRLDKFAHLPRLLSNDLALLEALRHADNAAQIDVTNRYLEEVNAIIGASDTYLLDHLGTTLAASNWQKDTSFIGRNFAFRPYFSQAMSLGKSEYFALGSTSGTRGYYYGHAIYNQAQAVGIVVIKMDLTAIESIWKDKSSVFVATDDRNIVFMSSTVQWLLKSLAPLDAKVRQRITDSQQYLDTNIESLDFVGDFSPLVTEVNSAVDKVFGTLIVSSKPLPKLHLTMRIFSAKHSIWISMLIYFALCSLLFVTIWLIWQLYDHRRQKFIQIETLQKAANQKLELQVMARTSELQAEISERMKTEQALINTQNELIQAAKLAVLGQMSASISHELNNPLAAIRSFADNAVAFIRKEQYDMAENNLCRIGDLTERMAKISHQLKAFARKSDPTTLVEAELRPLLLSCKVLLDPELKKQQITVNIALIEDCPKVIVNPIHVEQVIINLVTNAIDAMAEETDKILLISTELNADRSLSIHVDDNGCGLPPQQESSVFSPFVTSKSKGLGLGLSISHHLLKHMGGDLYASPSPTLKGARFTVQLPCSQ